MLGWTIFGDYGLQLPSVPGADGGALLLTTARSPSPISFWMSARRISQRPLTASRSILLRSIPWTQTVFRAQTRKSPSSCGALFCGTMRPF